MPDPYDSSPPRGTLVGREKVFGIKERVLFDGSVDEPLDEESVRAAIQGVRDIGGDGIVIALLHAYRNPDT